MTKGYPIQTGFMGWIPKISKYMLFATEDEYEEYAEEENGESEDSPALRYDRSDLNAWRRAAV